MRALSVCSVVIAASSVGCGDELLGVDAGARSADAGARPSDAGLPAVDAGPVVTPSSPLFPVAPCRASGQPQPNIGLGFPRIPERLASPGPIRATVLFADFDDAVAARTPQEVMDILSPTAERFFRDNSFGRQRLQLDPHLEWLRMSGPSAIYGQAMRTFEGHRDWLQEAIDLAGAAVDFSETDVVVLMATPQARAIPYGPTFTGYDGEGGTLRADGIEILNGVTSGADLLGWGGLWLVHELGHSLGLVDLYSYDAPRGFTRPFSLMDLISSEAPGLLAYERWQLGWIPDAQIACLSTSQTVRLVEMSRTDGVKAAVIPLGPTRVIVVESRRAIGWDQRLEKTGAVVYRVDTARPSGRAPVRVLNGQSALGLGERVSSDGVEVEVVSRDAVSDTARITISR